MKSVAPRCSHVAALQLGELQAVKMGPTLGQKHIKKQ